MYAVAAAAAEEDTGEKRSTVVGYVRIRVCETHGAPANYGPGYIARGAVGQIAEGKGEREREKEKRIQPRIR